MWLGVWTQTTTQPAVMRGLAYLKHGGMIKHNNGGGEGWGNTFKGNKNESLARHENEPQEKRGWGGWERHYTLL